MLSTIYIMWLREVKKFIRSRSRIIGSLVQPLFFFLALGYGLGSVFQAAGQGNYLEFVAPGIIGMSLIFGSIFNGMSIIWDRQFGFLKETLVAPVPRSAVMFGRTLGGATTTTFQGSLVLALMFIAGFHPASWALIAPALLVMLLISVMFTSLGLAVASLFTDVQGFITVVNFLTMPLFLLSGSLFPLQNAPVVLQWAAKADPLSYGIDALRALLINTSHFGLTLDLIILSVLAICFVGLGSHFFSKIEV